MAGPGAGGHIQDVRRLIHALVPALALLVGCSGSSDAPRQAKSAAQVPALPADAVWRRDVVAVVNRGLGSFLRHVDVEPRFIKGEFVGFRIVGLYPPSLWQDIDLRVGDVVTSVNGMPIERETEAFEAFEALRTADRLTVAYVRQGKPGELSYRILDRGARASEDGGPKAPGQPPTSPPSTSDPKSLPAVTKSPKA